MLKHMSALMKKLSGTWPNLERNEIDRGIDCATRPILTTRLEATPPNCLSLGPERKCARASTETLGPQLRRGINGDADQVRSEEHTSELQSLTNLVCRLLLAKKNRLR